MKYEVSMNRSFPRSQVGSLQEASKLTSSASSTTRKLGVIRITIRNSRLGLIHAYIYIIYYCLLIFRLNLNLNINIK